MKRFLKYAIILVFIMSFPVSTNAQTIKRSKQKTEHTQKNNDSKKSSKTPSKSTKADNQKSNNSSSSKKNKNQKADPTQVIYTGDIANKVIGYNGTTPLNITVKNGVIEDIEVLPNQESPAYLKRAMDKVLPQYIGKTVNEAKSLKPDIATGATYTSEALIRNIQMGLDQTKSIPAKNNSSKICP